MKLLAPLLFVALVGAQPSDAGAQNSAGAIVIQIKRADYEGDRRALKGLYQDLAPFADDGKIGSKVRYWRGFALWRRALIGFNESADPAEQEADLTTAIDEFEKAAALDPAFVDAKVGAASCTQNLGFLLFSQNKTARARDLILKSLPLLKEAQAAEPENPRLMWVLGAYQWNNPPERGGGQALAIETYEKGLKSARQHHAQVSDVLTPSWGEPELLMNLAYSKFRQDQPDLAAAQQYAQEAVELVPYWRFVQETLLPQIRAAVKASQESHPIN